MNKQTIIYFCNLERIDVFHFWNYIKLSDYYHQFRLIQAP